MDNKKKKEFDELLLLERELPESEFEKKVDAYLEVKSEKEKEEIGVYLLEVKLRRWKQYKEVTEEISVLEQLNGIENYLNLAKISESYFGKTKSWLYQRLHGYSVHGKPAKFTEDEKKKLAKALLSLSDNIKTVAHKFA
jgi:hypothetical protein